MTGVFLEVECESHRLDEGLRAMLLVEWMLYNTSIIIIFAITLMATKYRGTSNSEERKSNIIGVSPTQDTSCTGAVRVNTQLNSQQEQTAGLEFYI